MPATDGVTNLDAAHVPDKTSAETITGQWAFSKPVATPGGFNFTSNGDFEIWNGGTAVAPSEWTVVGAGATIARDGGAGNFKTGAYAAALTRVGTDCYLAYNVLTKAGPVAAWQSRPVILQAAVKVAVATRARIGVYDGSTVTYSPYHTGGGAIEMLSVALTLGAGITALEVRLYVDTGNTTAYFDSVVFTLGAALSGDFWPSGLATAPNVQVFTASGTYTPSPGMKYCLSIIKGGGGSGGGTNSINNNGGGGGEGETSYRFCTAAEIGASKAVTIAAAAAAIGANTNATGNAGGTCSLGTLVTAAGGAGGSAGPVGGAGGSGGNGGTSTWNEPGAPGQVGALADATKAINGAGGGRGAGQANGGVAAIANSGGGGGGGSTANPSGAGAQGKVVIIEYFS